MRNKMKLMNFETYPRTIEGQPFSWNFQAQYKAEVERQKMLLGIRSLDELVPVQDENDESDDVAWEDGWKAFLVGN